MHSLVTFSPIIHWTAHNAIDFTLERGGPLNPLYRQGFSRVGCFPCINARKNEIAKIGASYPEAIERIMQWEQLVAAASKRGKSTFFAGPTTPEGAAMCKAERTAKAKGLPTPMSLTPTQDRSQSGPERCGAANSSICCAMTIWRAAFAHQHTDFANDPTVRHP